MTPTLVTYGMDGMVEVCEGAPVAVSGWVLTVTLWQGTFGTWHVLPSISMVDSATCLRYAECSRAPGYIINGYGYPMQTISCTWR